MGPGRIGHYYLAPTSTDRHPSARVNNPSRLRPSSSASATGNVPELRRSFEINLFVSVSGPHNAFVSTLRVTSLSTKAAISRRINELAPERSFDTGFFREPLVLVRKLSPRYLTSFRPRTSRCCLKWSCSCEICQSPLRVTLALQRRSHIEHMPFAWITGRPCKRRPLLGPGRRCAVRPGD